MARADFRFSYRKRVRYSEIDAQAVLFNARYLDFADVASSEYFRAIGLAAGGTDGAEMQCHVVRAAVDYRKPIRYDEQIDLCIRVARIGTTSMRLLFEFHGHDADDLRGTGELIYVHVDEAAGRPTPWPDTAITRIEAYEGGDLRA